MDIKIVCQKCRGTGQIEPKEGMPTTICDRCEGTGRIDEGEIGNATHTLDKRITDIEDKINDILDKCNDIFEKVSE